MAPVPSTLTGQVSDRELCAQLNDVLARVSSSKERIGITREGEVVAVVIAVEDLQLCEDLEMARDLADYRRAKASDDGGRISATDLRAELES